jgi:phosphoglycerol transferase
MMSSWRPKWQGRSQSSHGPNVSWLFRELQFYVGLAAVIAAVLFLFLRGWKRDFHVPVGFGSDSLLALMQSKSTVDNGWWWFNPMIGAPDGLNQLAFPANSNVDQAIVWVVSRIVSDPLTAINLAWMAMVVLSGLIATWCAHLIGATRFSALTVGVLYALSPYALYRNIEHLWMVIYLVPFASTAGLLLASGIRLQPLRRRSHTVLLVGCALLGFNYVYYAFFACFLVLVGALIGFAGARRPRLLADGVLCVALIGGCTLVNLAPSMYVWNRDGTPVIIRDKVPAESEVYGLKIRHLVSPLFGHPVGVLRRWTENEAAARFPLETENITSRLGLVGTIGFLGLLAVLLADGSFSERYRTLRAAARLVGAAVLLGTIGGFGSLFSLLISPEIRAYNRISPFISYFALLGVALGLELLVRRASNRIVAIGLLLVLGLFDQSTAAAGMNAEYEATSRELGEIETFVHQLEERMTDGSIVFQLPVRMFLNDEGIAQLRAYEHLKLYLVSRSLRWSYPALSNAQVGWQQSLMTMAPKDLADDLSVRGFSAILIDRRGYDDEGRAIIDGLRQALPEGSLKAQTARHVVFSLSDRSASDTSTIPEPSNAPRTVAMKRCEETPLMNVDLIGGVRSPFGAPVRVEASHGLRVSGWAIDPIGNGTAGGVEIEMNGAVSTAIYGIDRPDVAAHFRNPGYWASGFTAVISRAHVAPGPHSLNVRVVAANRDCYYQAAGIPLIAN